MKILKGVVVSLLVIAAPLLAIAQDKPRKELNPWVDCGIGAMIFEDTTWAAVISNIIWDLGTTAVTSDQSSQNACNSKKAKAAMFVGATYANLTDETVKGDGKHLNAMLDIMGCQAASHSSIIGSIRSQFGLQLQDAGYVTKTSATKAEDFYNMVEKTISGGYAQQCRV